MNAVNEKQAKFSGNMCNIFDSQHKDVLPLFIGSINGVK